MSNDVERVIKNAQEHLKTADVLFQAGRIRHGTLFCIFCIEECGKALLASGSASDGANIGLSYHKKKQRKAIFSAHAEIVRKGIIDFAEKGGFIVAHTSELSGWQRDYAQKTDFMDQLNFAFESIGADRFDEAIGNAFDQWPFGKLCQLQADDRVEEVRRSLIYEDIPIDPSLIELREKEILAWREWRQVAQLALDFATIGRPSMRDHTA